MDVFVLVLTCGSIQSSDFGNIKATWILYLQYIPYMSCFGGLCHDPSLPHNFSTTSFELFLSRLFHVLLGISVLFEVDWRKVPPSSWIWNSVTWLGKLWEKTTETECLPGTANTHFFQLMLGETIICHGKIWNHPIETNVLCMDNFRF